MLFQKALFLSALYLFFACTNLNAYEYEEDMPLEVDSLLCPQGCVCQYARFKDLPLSRWIDYAQTRSDTDDWNASPALDLAANPYIKQATCIIQPENNLPTLVQALPHDLQALILLYTGVAYNETIKTSDLQLLNQLHSLEIRAAAAQTLCVLLDKPLPFLLHANFERVSLQGTKNSQPPKSVKHPRDIFNYKPRSEYLDDSLSEQLQLELIEQHDNEMVSYEVYTQNLKEERMARFYGWQSLEILRIIDCQLQELHWQMFMGLHALQHLLLEHNNIKQVPPYAFFDANNLRTLSLAHNDIVDMHYTNLAGLLQLEQLDLSYNRLHLLSELTFPPFPKLQVADFQQNPIKHIFPAAFWVMNSTLSMTFNSQAVTLELLNNAPFDTLRLLNNLVIGNVYVKILQQNMFKGLVSLRKLRLHGQIYVIEFDAFAHLLALQELDLSHCQLQEVSMDAFMGLHNLLILNLSHNNLTYLPSGIFDEQPLLQQVYLQFNHLQTLPNNFFQQTHLVLAQLHDNPWQCSCDMSGWLARITNKRATGVKERCITDYQTGYKYNCKLAYSYTMDRSLAPRCVNFNERSLYFVLRRQLRCDKPKYVPHWRKVELLKGKTAKDNHENTLDYALQATDNKKYDNEIDILDENLVNEI